MLAHYLAYFNLLWGPIVRIVVTVIDQISLILYFSGLRKVRGFAFIILLEFGADNQFERGKQTGNELAVID